MLDAIFDKGQNGHRQAFDLQYGVVQLKRKIEMIIKAPAEIDIALYGFEFLLNCDKIFDFLLIITEIIRKKNNQFLDLLIFMNCRE